LFLAITDWLTVEAKESVSCTVYAMMSAISREITSQFHTITFMPYLLKLFEIVTGIRFF